MIKEKKSCGGFTLIEIMLVVGIILIVGFFSAAFSTRMIPQMAVSSTADIFRSVLGKAQVYAISGREYSPWGVHYENHMITMFKGDSYAMRNTNFDEKTKIDEMVEVSGFADNIFALPNGMPSEFGRDIIISSKNMEKMIISLNKEGVVE